MRVDPDVLAVDDVAHGPLDLSWTVVATLLFWYHHDVAAVAPYGDLRAQEILAAYE